MNHLRLREEVCRVNRDLVAAGLVTLTWGNASGVDRGEGVMAIKPSGVPYESLRPEDLVVLSLGTGEVLEGRLKPSSDTPTHMVLYRRFPHIGGVVHTHSTHATAWAQAGKPIPCLGTTHADCFRGEIPVTRRLSAQEIAGPYEQNTGLVVVEAFEKRGINPDEVPACLVHGHGPFVWGGSPRVALENAVALEALAGIAIETRLVNPDAQPLGQALLDRHFTRKHGAGAGYGQR